MYRTKRRAKISATLIALSLMLALGQLNTMGQTLLDIATDANDPENLSDSEPSIAVNPRNPMEISIVTFSGFWGSTAAPVWRSTNGGLTWNKLGLIPAPASGGDGPQDQHLSYDSLGQLYLVELEVQGPPQKIVDYIYRQSNVSGAAHLAGIGYGDDQPHVAVDRSTTPCANRVYSPWLKIGSPVPPVMDQSMVSNSEDNGVHVNDLGAGDNRTFPNRTTRIALAPNGEVFVVYKTREGATSADFENAHFRVLRSDDCGRTWLGLGPSGVSVHGELPVQTWYTGNFGNPAKGKKTNRARSSDAWIAVDPSDGDVYVAYVRRETSGVGQIYVARSTDRGTTWTSSRVTNGTHNSAFPEIVVAENGAIGVLYIDYDDAGPRTTFRHHFSRSLNDGASWTDKVLQSMDPEPIENAPSGGYIWGDYEGLTAAGNTFFGVFTGQSIGRTKLQLDPIFFTEPATP